jgi:hypothetical protein
MPYTIGRLIPRAALAAFLFLAAVPQAHAQMTTPAVVPAPDTPDFMSRYDFHLSAAAVSVNDPRFSWETHFGGDIDVADYVVGRSSILVDYEAVLGDEFRAFDPNQGNYTLEASTSARIGQTEVAAMFHHVSRHLSDRPKRFAIAWNILGARILRRVSVDGVTIDAVASAGKVVQNSFVDYTWTGDLDLMIRRPITPRVGVFAHGFGDAFMVDQTIANRGRQLGGTVEVGLRIHGRAGAVELFAGAETRVDADPIDRIARRWALAGFRLLSE